MAVYLLGQLLVQVARWGMLVELGRAALTVDVNPGRRLTIPLADIAGCRVTSCDESAAKYFGIMTVRTPGGKCTVARLDHGDGVELTLTDGRRVFIGSRRPQELAAKIEEAARAFCQGNTPAAGA